MPKTSSSDATGVVPSGLGCAAWQFRMCCQVIRENQRSLERMMSGEKCDPARQKRYGRGFKKRMVPNSARCPLAGLEAFCA